MTAPIDLPPMTQAEALALVNKAWHRSNPSIHYDGCWRDHLPCAVAEVERLTKELEALRHEHKQSLP